MLYIDGYATIELSGPVSLYSVDLPCSMVHFMGSLIYVLLLPVVVHLDAINTNYIQNILIYIMYLHD